MMCRQPGGGIGQEPGAGPVVCLAAGRGGSSAQAPIRFAPSRSLLPSPVPSRSPEAFCRG